MRSRYFLVFDDLKNNASDLPWSECLRFAKVEKNKDGSLAFDLRNESVEEVFDRLWSGASADRCKSVGEVR